jgi:hypothetical protein
MATAISDEARAKNNLNPPQAGLTFFAPNINVQSGNFL